LTGARWARNPEPDARSGVDRLRAGVSTSKASCVTAFVLLVGGGGVARAREASHQAWAEDAELRLRLGARAVDVIDGAERIEIARVEARRLEAPGAADAPANVGGFPLVGEFEGLGADFLEGFQRVLLDRKTYELPPPRSAITPLCGGFQPGVALRFWPKGRGRPALVFLSFQCSELATWSGSAAAPGARVLFQPGRLELLRLVGAALPERTELATMLAAEQGDRARELAFESMFTPDVLVAFDHVSLTRDDGAVAAAAELRRHASGKALFVLAARALGVKGNDMHGSDGPTAALYAAVRALGPAEVAAGLEAIRGDQVALAGATELLALSGVAAAIPEAVRVAWVPSLLEAFLAQNASWHCPLIRKAANRAGRSLVPLLVRVLRGQAALASWPTQVFRPPEPSDAGCALMALAATDEDAARVGLATWRPASPLDALAARAARARLGDDGALDGTLLATRSPTIRAMTLDAIVAHPSRRALDVLAENLDAGTGAGADGERAFRALTGARIPKRDGEAQEAAALRSWWEAHREGWRPLPRAVAR
jgi:hypothetical protein